MKENESRGFVENLKKVAVIGWVVAGLIWMVKSIAGKNGQGKG